MVIIYNLRTSIVLELEFGDADTAEGPCNYFSEFFVLYYIESLCLFDVGVLRIDKARFYAISKYKLNSSQLAAFYALRVDCYEFGRRLKI